MSLRVLLADDDENLRTGIAALLMAHQDVESVLTATDGHEALALIDVHSVSVVLLDIEMPGCDGIRATKLIKQLHPELPVIIFTAFDDLHRIEQAMRYGASGYLTKDLPIDTIVQCLHQALQGITVLAPLAAERLFFLQSSGHTSYMEDDSLLRDIIDTLPTRLRNILAQLVQGKSNQEIAETLRVNESTVRTYISELLSLCGCTSRTQLAVRAMRAGRG